MKNIRNFILASSMFLLALFALHAQPAAAALFDGSKGAACGGVVLSNTSQACDPKAGKSISDLVKVALNIVSLIAGIAAVFMIIIAGIKFITSQGEASNIASARNTILYAVIGLVVVATSQIIVRFVLKKAAV